MELTKDKIFVSLGRAMMGYSVRTPDNHVRVKIYSDGFWTNFHSEKVDVICSCGAKCHVKTYGRLTHINCPECGFEDFIPTGYYLRSPVTMPSAPGKSDVPFGHRLWCYEKRRYCRGLSQAPQYALLTTFIDC
ncbi:hypothetical protein KKH36_03535 [Patescibacteria group bacterium]|nr:hypothetical protein [Patescibacteria group bacterium]